MKKFINSADDFLKESLQGFGRIWKCQNCVTVTKSTAKRATQATQGATKGCQKGPKITTWTQYGRQMAAEAELLQQIVSKKLLEKCKTP